MVAMHISFAVYSWIMSVFRCEVPAPYYKRSTRRELKEKRCGPTLAKNGEEELRYRNGINSPA